MTIRDLFAETWLALSGNRLRSGLTMLGIIIGIGSVIALTGVGQGATASVTSSISALGSNLLIVSPGAARRAGPVSGGAGSAQTLTADDVKAIKNDLSAVKTVAADLTGRYQITAKGTNTNTSVIGTETAYMSVRNISVAQGSFFTDRQVAAASKVAVVGPDTAETLFGTEKSPIGQTIKINHVEFKIIGITKSKGGSGFTNSDDVVYIPLAAAQRYLAGKASALSNISIEALDAESVDLAQTEVTDLLLTRHGIADSTKADFTVLNQADIQSSLSESKQTLTVLLGAIAGISLLVGGIGIMNMMLTSVTERTREIGLRKAIGATATDITTQFLMEAIVLTVIGGLIGTLLGFGVAVLVTKLGLVTATVTTSAVLLAVGVSAVVGVVFGYYPARRASRLRPIDALKYE